VRLLRFFSGEDTERPDGVALIAAERDRQVREEGWTAEHDDTHTNGELAVAAACYLLDHKIAHPPGNWPFEVEAWKPARRTGETRIDELVKAGAMVAAQIDIHLRDPERHTGKPDCKCKDCLAYDASSPR
jgi:hypothetical protein